MALTKATQVPAKGVTYPGSSDVESEIQALKGRVSNKYARDFGVTCDGTTDDSQSLRDALASLVSGDTLIIQSGKLRVSSPVLIDFSGKENISIIMDGYLMPDAGVGSALTIKNLSYSYLKLQVNGGGGSLVDYSTPDPAGAQQAFVLDSLRCVKVDLLGLGYKGRVLRTQSTGSVKLSFLNLDIRTGDSYNQCYQACYLQGADSAYGTISSAQTQWDFYGSVLDSITDITITYWEYGASTTNLNPALTFNKISSAHISVLAGGQGAGTGTALKVQEGVAITIDKLFTTECAVGLHVVGRTPTGVNEVNKQLTIGSHYSYGSNQKALVLQGVRNVSILDCHYDSVGDYGVYLEGTIRDVDIKGYLRNPNISCVKSATGSDISRLKLSCRFYSSSARDLIDLSEGTIGYVQLTDCTASSAGGRPFKLQATNSVQVSGGEYTTTASSLWDNRPNVIIGTNLPKVDATGASNVPNGAVNGTVVTVPHRLGVVPTDVSYVWRGIPRPGAVLVVTNIDSTNIEFTLLTDGTFAAQVNFRWSASGSHK